MNLDIEEVKKLGWEQSTVISTAFSIPELWVNMIYDPGRDKIAILMPKDIIIPPFLKHLKVHTTGYPIPYFAGYINGKPDFRLLDARKQVWCIEHKLCAICGKKLFKGCYYFISGPMGYENRISTDPAMHKECATYSLNVCPHLHFQKAQRREAGVEHLVEQQGALMMDKPNTLLMVKAHHFEKIKNPEVRGAWLIKFKPMSYETWTYDNGILTQVYLTT